MAKDDYEAGLLGETAGHDIFSPDYQAGTRARQRGGGGGGGALAGLGSGGIVFVAIMVIVAFFAFIVAIGTYPIAGTITGIAFAIGMQVTNGDGQSTMNSVGLIFAWMIPCYIVYIFAMKLEHFVAGYRLYRAFRTFWRIVFGTLLGFVIGSAFHTQGGSFTGIGVLDHVLHWFVTVVGFVGGYMNSIRLDDKHNFDAFHIRPLDRVVKLLLGWAPGYRDSAFFVRKKRGWKDVLHTTPYEPAATQDSESN
jgi:hypothetical protein